MKRLCGLRPTGKLHIGHFFAVIEPARYKGATVLIATYHAPEETTDIIPTLRRFCVDSESYVLQQDVFNPRLYFRLLSLAGSGELERMTQYRGSDRKTAHLFVYPVLMAHDVAGFDEVIVGEDQTQHLNYARDLLARYNQRFGEPVRIPEASPIAGRVMSLSDPTKKMSKSEPKGCLFLDDPADVIEHKINKAVTTEEGRANLIDLYKRLGGEDSIPEMNAHLKAMLTGQLLQRLKDARNGF